MTFQIKTNKASKRKILFIEVKGNIPEDEKLADEILDVYFEHVKANPGISLIIDAREVAGIPRKTIMKKMDKLKAFDPIAQRNVLCSAPIVKPGILMQFIKMVTSLYPMVIPNKICYDPKEAVDYVKSKWKM